MKHSANLAARSAAASGFTLVEVLVAVVVLAVGMLALAGVQGTNLGSVTSSYQRTQASMAAMEIADRMRANMAGVDANDYAAIASPPAGTAPTSCVGAGSCTTAGEMAAYDAYDWLTSLAGNRDLLSAEGAVACIDSDTGDGDACTDGSLHQITIRWDGRKNGATGTGCNPSVLTDKICYRVTFQP